MADATVTGKASAERLQKLSRLLRDLKVTEEYLRQYPSLAERVAALMEGARPSSGKG